MAKFRKVLKIAAIVLAGILAVYLLLQIAGIRVFYGRYSRVSEKVQRIPGLSDGFVPQGITFSSDGTLLMCGYMGNKSPSRIYRISNDGSVCCISLKKVDGSDYTGHAGGLTASGDYVYVSNASKLFVLPLSSVLEAKDGDTLTFCASIPVPCNASYCSSDGTFVYVGEYHAKGYSTDETHKVTCSDGTVYQAMTFAYRLDESGQWGLADATAPDHVYATCDRVQGFVFNDGKVYVSCSSGFRNSSLESYDAQGTDGTFSCNGRDIPMTVLDSGRRLDVLVMPHMSEDLEIRGNVLYTLFEAGAKRMGSGIVPFTVRHAVSLDVL